MAGAHCRRQRSGASTTFLAYIAHQTALLQTPDLIPIWFEQPDLLLERSTRDGFLDAVADRISAVFVEHF